MEKSPTLEEAKEPHAKAADTTSSTAKKANQTHEPHRYGHQCSEHLHQGLVNTDYFHVPDEWRRNQSIQLAQAGDDLLDDLDRFTGEGGAVPPDANNNHNV